MTNEEQEAAELIRCECNRVYASITEIDGEEVLQIKCPKCKKMHKFRFSIVFK